MITQIQLGNVFSSGDKTVFGGSASGIDTESLVESLVEAKRLPAVQLETRLEENAAKQSAIGDLKDILNRFKDTADLLRNPPGVQNDLDDIFSYRNAELTSNTSVSADNYATATAVPGANVSSFDLTVEQLATYNTKITETFALADADTDAVGAGLPFNAGTFTIGTEAATFELDADDTLNQVVAKINAVSELNKVNASILQVSDGNYRVIFKTTETGADLNYDLAPAPPSPPAFVTANAIFRLDAQDWDGDGDYYNNPVADTPAPAPIDASGNTTVSTANLSPNLDVDGAESGMAAFDFSSANQAYNLGSTADINIGGPYTEKSIAVSFQTGSDISGTQTIFKQGSATRSIGLFIQPDAGNGNAPTLYGVVFNTDWGGQEFKVVNLGTVSADTTYNVVLDFDATANPGANDPANTLTGYVNGTQIDQETDLAQILTSAGNPSIGRISGSAGLPDSTVGLTGSYFEGSVNEVILMNQSLSSTEIDEVTEYFDNKFVQPASLNALMNVGLAITEDATDAQFTVDGTAITRSSNSVDDVIEDITLSLKQVTPPGTELTMDIEPDTEVARDAILNFVDTYNELRVFFSSQTLRNEDGSPTEDSALLGNTALRTTMNRILNETARIVDGITGGDPEQLSEIGIEFTDFPGNAETPFTRNIMVVDEDILMGALEANFDAVKRVFAFDFQSDEPELQVFSRTNALDISSFTLDIDITGGVYEATYDPGSGPVTVTLDAEALSSGSGYLLKGQEGTVLEGLELIYADTADSFGINVTVTQGISDSVYNTLDGLLDSQDGLITNEEQNLLDAADRIEEEIERIEDSIERFRLRLLERFAGLEAVISQAETILQSLDAQAAAAAS